MLLRIRKFISADIKEKISNSLPYRLINRISLHYNKENRFSCELTTKCNLKCEMCARSILIKDKKLYIRDMEKEVIERVIDEIKQFHKHGEKVAFTPMGLGEPILFDGLLDLFSDIKIVSKSIRIILVTNGILLDETFSKKLISLDIDEVSISLNANNPQDYFRYMGTDMYDRVCYNIENLIRLRNESGKKLPSVLVQYLDFMHNRDIFKEDIRKWLKIMRYNDKSYIHPIVNEAGFYTGKYVSKSKKENFPCTQPLERIAVKVNGDIYPCDPCLYSGTDKISSLYMGNIKEHSPFKLHIQPLNKRLEIIKRMQKDNYALLPECKRCDTREIGCNCFFKLPKLLSIGGYKWL